MFVQFLVPFILFGTVIPLIFLGLVLIAPHPGPFARRLRGELWYHRTAVVVYAAFAPFAVAFCTFGGDSLFLVYILGGLAAYIMAVWWLATERGLNEIKNGYIGLYLLGIFLASFAGVGLVLSRTPWLADLPPTPNAPV